MKHLLAVADLGTEGIEEVLRVTDSFVEVSSRAIPKVPALRGKTVVSLFYENSTRTRLSFETAARRLSADTMNFTAPTSSVSKGESLRDTVETIEAMGIDAVVVRHGSAGVPQRIASWIDASVVNAGDGWHEHPTQALLDCYTIRQRRGSLEGLHIAVVGDVKHSRVARSDVAAFSLLGAEVTLVAPPTLLPPSLEGWPVSVSYDLDAVLPKADVVYVLRLQNERMAGPGGRSDEHGGPGGRSHEQLGPGGRSHGQLGGLSHGDVGAVTEALLPSLREYTASYGLTRRRADLLPDDALVMHPGPMNRGVEIAADVAALPGSVITTQVANGVAVRMAVLYLLLGSGQDLAG